MKSFLSTKNVFMVCCLVITGCTKTDLTGSNTGKSSLAFSPGTSIELSKRLCSWSINTICGNGIQGYAGDGGPALNASLNGAPNLNLDKDGNVYICDAGNNVIRMVNARTGIITTVAGNGIEGFAGDGGLATQASLDLPFHIAVDDHGNLYISDLLNNRIRKVEKTTGIITTIAGTGVQGYNGDGNNALLTNLSIPMGIALDNHGDLLFSDETGLRLRKLNMKTRIITTIAGSSNRGFGGDGGPATRATFNFIWNVAIDNQGTIYLSDESNYRMRKINGKTGIISTFAGNGVLGNSGNGGLATNASFTQPVGIAVDDNGNTYITDEVLSQIYVVDKKTGIINLIAGQGFNGFSGDGGLAINALLAHPNSLAVDNKGDLYVSDDFNNRIRKLTRR
jgi:trimeric autotransporter adhesin